PADVDLIVFATMTPDVAFPGSGCYLQNKLGCRTVGALDVRAQCAGFLFALATADRFVRAGAAGRVLVACAEVHSTALDYTPRAAAVTPYFGDGAGVLVLGAAREPAEAARRPRERVVATAEAAGHIAAAGIPIALADAVAAGRVGKGDLVCGVAFGAGMSWGGGLLRL